VPSMQSTSFEPLSYSEVPPRSAVERIGMWVPVLGWVVASVLEARRLGPCERRVREALAARPPIPSTVWDGEARARVAQDAGRGCAEAVGWPNDHFIPEDPMECVLCWRTGDLCEVEALMKLEQTFGMRFSKDETARIVGMTLSEFVDFILFKQSQRSD